MAACLAVGPLVTAPQLHRAEVWWLLIATSAGLVATLAVIGGRPPRLSSAGSAALAVGLGAAAVVAACCGLAVALGTTPTGLLHGLVLQHRRYLGGFFVPPEVSWPALGLGIAVAAAIALAARGRPAVAASGRLLAGLAMVLLPAAAHLAAGFRELTSGLEDRGAEALLLGFATPLVWLSVRPGEADGRAAPARALLALTAAMAVLGCYPVAGGQLAAATVLLPVVGLVLVADGLHEHVVPPVRRTVVVVVVALAVAGTAARLSFLPQLYAELEPLGLPGTAGIRTEPEEVARWHWLAEELAARADTFVFFPFTWNSLYLWTGIEPPTGLNFTDWPGVLDDAERARIIAALDRHRRPCVVWYHADRLPQRWLAEPLALHLQRYFVPVARYGRIDILARGSGGVAAPTQGLRPSPAVANQRAR